MALAFKPDSSFFRKIVVGAVGAQAVCKTLAAKGHDLIELERGSTDAKLWKDVKRKRVRMPDLVCKKCGVRIESRAKTNLELAMSHSPTQNERAWDYGLVDNDWVAFPVVKAVENELLLTRGRLGLTTSYWHERNMVEWETSQHVNMFTVGAFRTVIPDKQNKKGVTEGSEIVIAWKAAFAPCAGIVKVVDGKRVQIETADKKLCWKRPTAPVCVKVGDLVEEGQVIASVVPPLTAQSEKCSGQLPAQFLKHSLESRERTLRFTGVKLARILGDKTLRPLLESIANDAVEDIYIRLEALAYLTAVYGKRVPYLFTPYLKSPDEQIRLEAVITVGEVGNADAVSTLAAFLHDVNEPFFIRSACAWCLGRIGSIEAQKELRKAFKDVNKSVREDALEAVISIGQAAFPGLKTGVLSTDPEVAAGCAEALRQGGREQPETVVDLVKLLGKHEPPQWLVWLIGNLPSNEITTALAQVQDVDARVHYAVSLLWAFSRSWIARRWELQPNAHREKWDVE